jgi:ASCH domain
MKALLIKQPWIDKILRGKKQWELHGSRTKVRGLIALIQSGTGTVVGTCELMGVKGPLSLAELRRSTARHRVPLKRLPYPRTYAWVLRGARRLPKSVRYDHPSGAVIWVNLSSRVATAIRRRTNRRT